MKRNLHDIGEWIGQFGERLVIFVKSTVVLIGMIFLIGVSIQPLRRLLISRNVLVDDVVNEAIGVAFLLSLILMTLVYKRLSALQAAVKPGVPSQEIILGGVGTAYPSLLESIRSVKSGDEKTLSILGLTLSTAWPMIHAWKEHLRGWTVTLYCLDPEHIKSNPDHLSRTWANKSQAVIDDFNENSRALHESGIRLTLKTYAMFPGIIGFRIGTGDILVAIGHWEITGARAKVAEPVHFYQWFRHADYSARAACYRQMFASWFSAVERFVVRPNSPETYQAVAPGVTSQPSAK
jgi:hypothetical protein